MKIESNARAGDQAFQGTLQKPERRLNVPINTYSYKTLFSEKNDRQNYRQDTRHLEKQTKGVVK